MERSLSNEDIKALGEDYKVEDKRSGGDRRVAINTCVDPAMDRRSGYDRRRNR